MTELRYVERDFRILSSEKKLLVRRGDAGINIDRTKGDDKLYAGNIFEQSNFRGVRLDGN